MVRESILHKLRPCKNPECKEPTPYPDGYCETCIPPEQIEPEERDDDEDQ